MANFLLLFSTAGQPSLRMRQPWTRATQTSFEEANCHVRLQIFSQFCVVDSREHDCLFFNSVCKDTRRKLQKHCRRFEVDNFNESSSDYRYFFAPDSCFSLLPRRCRPSCVTRHYRSPVFFLVELISRVSITRYRLPFYFLPELIR